jgi:hypothetical protein
LHNGTARVFEAPPKLSATTRDSALEFD